MSIGKVKKKIKKNILFLVYISCIFSALFITTILISYNNAILSQNFNLNWFALYFLYGFSGVCLTLNLSILICAYLIKKNLRKVYSYVFELEKESRNNLQKYKILSKENSRNLIKAHTEEAKRLKIEKRFFQLKKKNLKKILRYLEFFRDETSAFTNRIFDLSSYINHNKEIPEINTLKKQFDKIQSNVTHLNKAIIKQNISVVDQQKFFLETNEGAIAFKSLMTFLHEIHTYVKKIVETVCVHQHDTLKIVNGVNQFKAEISKYLEEEIKISDASKFEAERAIGIFGNPNDYKLSDREQYSEIPEFSESTNENKIQDNNAENNALPDSVESKDLQPKNKILWNFIQNPPFEKPILSSPAQEAGSS